MKQSRILVYAVAVAGLLTVGTIGIRAAPTCERFVKVYSERVIHHHVSKETAARWAIWGKEHPNYRPKKRPPLTPQESLKKVAVACEVPLTNMTFSGLLPPKEETDFLISAEEPVYIATAAPVFTLVGTPLDAAPLLPTDDLPTPEPSTFILLGSAVALLLFWKRDRLLKSFIRNQAALSWSSYVRKWKLTFVWFFSDSLQ